MRYRCQFLAASADMPMRGIHYVIDTHAAKRTENGIEFAVVAGYVRKVDALRRVNNLNFAQRSAKGFAAAFHAERFSRAQEG